MQAGGTNNSDTGFRKDSGNTLQKTLPHSGLTLNVVVMEIAVFLYGSD